MKGSMLKKEQVRRRASYMALEDKEKTTFITTWGTFCYKVMPFELKNAGATYQRAMYVDDMITKSKTPEQHVEDLRKLFERLRKYKLRLNPAKYTFGVKSGKLLGFVVKKRGKEVDPNKVKAIWGMLAPRTESEVCGFLGRINYIACSPIFKLLCKNQKMDWDPDCDYKTRVINFQEAFKKIKKYLENPLVLVSAILGKPLILYLTMLEESMGCVLGQQDATGKKEQAIYYLSKNFINCEKRHPALKSGKYGNGIRVILVSPKGQCFPFSARLGFDCTNNMTEYEAYAMGIMMALEHQVKELKTRDAKLIPNQEWHIDKVEVDAKPWYYDINRYLEKGVYIEGVRLASRFFLSGTILYKRSTYMTLLRCIDDWEAKEIMEEVHEGTFGTRLNGHALA
ncbi:Retrovirus-related Pol polyprotein from transposon 17.6, partial [Mucuna pruriens]